MSSHFGHVSKGGGGYIPVLRGWDRPFSLLFCGHGLEVAVFWGALLGGRLSLLLRALCFFLLFLFLFFLSTAIIVVVFFGRALFRVRAQHPPCLPIIARFSYFISESFPIKFPPFR
jgi:hypothetical protein